MILYKYKLLSIFSNGGSVVEPFLFCCLIAKLRGCVGWVLLILSVLEQCVIDGSRLYCSARQY